MKFYLSFLILAFLIGFFKWNLDGKKRTLLVIVACLVISGLYFASSRYIQ